MDRRLFLKSVGVMAGAVSAGGLLAGCGEGGGGIPEGDPTLNVINASFETLTGTDRRFAFGVSSLDNVPVKDADIQVYVRDVDGTVLSGPYETEFFDEGGPALGVYLTHIDVPDSGTKLITAVNGNDYGEAAVNVVSPDQSQLPVPGEPALVTATATVEEDLGLAELCTQEPDCGMHDVSLAQAVEEGRPVVLLFATPAYCQTAVCAPAVNTLDEVRQSQDWGEVAFIHQEIFSDQGQTLAQPVQDWGLPTEPWLFTIGPDGQVANRLDGPMIGAELTQLIEELRVS